MATYIFGDIQGCFSSLQALLRKINYRPDCDRLGFVGDLVNRGPQSLETLRFIHQLDDPIIVLGNHDLYLLALGCGAWPARKRHTLDAILQAPDKDTLLNWLRQQPLLYEEKIQQAVIVHAGIPPQWDINTAKTYALEVQQQLRSENYLRFLSDMYGIEPCAWEKAHHQTDRWRYIVNAFMRLRFCDAKGRLDLDNKTANPADTTFKPWYEWRHDDNTLIFGHWAALQGHCDKPNVYALDTGCVWGNRLTALRLEDKSLHSVGCAT